MAIQHMVEGVAKNDCVAIEKYTLCFCYRQKLHAKDKPRKYNRHIKKNASTAMLNRK